MKKRRVMRFIVTGVLGAAVSAGLVVLLSGAAAAPTTEGLILQAVGHRGAAAAGNRNEAYLFVSGYNASGPVRGIPEGSLSVVVVGAPAGADPIKKVGVTEPVSGVYRISLTPDLSSHRWSSGMYVLSVTFTSPNGSGVVLGDVLID